MPRTKRTSGRLGAISGAAVLIVTAALAAPAVAGGPGGPAGGNPYPNAVHAPALPPSAAVPAPAPGTAQNSGRVPIVGGHNATEAPPFIAALYKGGRFACTASLVAAHWILTADHCIGGSLSVRVGSLQRESGGQTANVTQQVSEPSGSDIALLRIDKDIQAQYPTLGGPGDAATGTRERVYGYGYTRSDWSQLSNVLKYSEGTIYDSRCNVLGATLCIENDGDTAGGDSGGPMLTDSGRLIGTCTAGNKPTDGSGFGAYSDITRYRSWIDRTIGQ
ncbi:trypsin-like serine protease [Actinomadura sp. KC06]|nr:trypsin-like serine protease [Actinomadura sp. KC06]